MGPLSSFLRLAKGAAVLTPVLLAFRRGDARAGARLAMALERLASLTGWSVF